MLAVDKETDRRVLHDAGLIKEQHQVAPLSLLGQLGAPETYVSVVQQGLHLRLRVDCQRGEKVGVIYSNDGNLVWLTAYSDMANFNI